MSNTLFIIHVMKAPKVHKPWRRRNVLYRYASGCGRGHGGVRSTRWYGVRKKNWLTLCRGRVSYPQVAEGWHEVSIP